MRVLVGMSGGVDSSVAAGLLVEEGHEVTGVTLKLWGGESDSGCCSVSDVEDARWAADQLGIEHVVFNFGDDFVRDVVDPYVAAHAAGATPNPCIECNRSIKFDRLVRRAEALGFDAVATGHHARVARDGAGRCWVSRGADARKDQSYVLYVVPGHVLARVLLPVGRLTKAEVRAEADRMGLRTATKPDSQDVCFITSTAGRAGFLEGRLPLHTGRLVDRSGEVVGQVAQVELVTVGQRRGLDVALDGRPRYALDVDVAERVVTVGTGEEMMVEGEVLEDVVWAHEPHNGAVLAQASAHGEPRRADVEPLGPARVALRWHEPQRRVAPGQSVALYSGSTVVGGGTVGARAGGARPRSA